jgi:hypothetical protein
LIPTRTLRPHVSSTRLAYKYQTFLTIDRAHFTLRLWKDLHLAHSYKIAVGRQGLETPAGLYEINDRQVNPVLARPEQRLGRRLGGPRDPAGPRRSDQVPLARLLQRRRNPRHRRDLVTRHRGLARLLRMSIPDVEQLYPQVPVCTRRFTWAS